MQREELAGRLGVWGPAGRLLSGGERCGGEGGWRVIALHRREWGKQQCCCGRRGMEKGWWLGGSRMLPRSGLCERECFEGAGVGGRGVVCCRCTPSSPGFQAPAGGASCRIAARGERSGPYFGEREEEPPEREYPSRALLLAVLRELGRRARALLPHRPRDTAQRHGTSPRTPTRYRHQHPRFPPADRPWLDALEHPPSSPPPSTPPSHTPPVMHT